MSWPVEQAMVTATQKTIYLNKINKIQTWTSILALYVDVLRTGYSQGLGRRKLALCVEEKNVTR